MGVILTYNNTQILNLDDSANKTIKTGGKYCSHDISLAFTKEPSGIACIYATYPVGWTCSCSNGQVAEDTSGEYLFFVEELGTYTLTISNGSLSKSTTVNVSTKWRSYNAEFGISYIHVTYPVGWTCTCTYGQQVQTATDTSGEFTFTALSTGTYSLKAVNGSSEATASVNVVSYSSTYNCVLSPEFLILVDGEFREEYQFVAQSGSATKKQGYYDIVINDTQAYVYVMPKIESTDYSTLHIKYKMPTSTTGKIILKCADSISSTPFASIVLPYSGNFVEKTLSISGAVPYWLIELVSSDTYSNKEIFISDIWFT